MITLFLFATLLLGLSSAQDRKAIEAKSVKSIATYVDPIQINPCYPKPTPSDPFLSWDGTFLSAEWWEYVRSMRRLPRKIRRRSVESSCKKPWSPQKDMRRYYWQISCPYEVFWLSHFVRKIPGSPGLTESCYVLFPCWEQVRICNCTTTYCTTRCRIPHPNIENSVCLENNLRTYTNVWVFCPHTHKKRRGKWIDEDCKSNPRRCLKRVTVSVPQSCECWSCWDMFVTNPNWKGKK